MYKVYVADDSVLVRKEIILTTPWKDLDCVVVGQAGDGRTAYNEILSLHPDIVIADIKMPKMDGLKLISELKKQREETEFIVISGYSEFEYAITAIKLEVKNYILKPISDDELKDTLRKTIEQIKKRKNIERLNSNVQNAVKTTKICFEDILKTDFNQNSYIKKITDYMFTHYMEDTSVKDVANNFFISESYLAKLFKREMNVTFNDYLTYIRIKASMEMLKVNQAKVYEVSLAVGYKDYRYFSLIFKKLVGMSPKEYQMHLTDIPGN